jgi:hypothetical protein
MLAPAPHAPSLREPPVYRPFALIALGATLLGGTPLGTVMLARLDWDLQIVGFFATLIVGVAQHLVPRFAGGAVTRRPWAPWLAVGLGAALALRVAGTAMEWGALMIGTALLQAVGFATFGVWVARALAAPHLRLTRAQLTVATAWIVAALILEASLRAWVAADGGPPAAGMRTAHAMAICGGVLGWIVGVVLRAGPMLVSGWSVPPVVARLAPAGLALGVVVTAVGVAGPWPGATRVALERAGEAIALGTVAIVAVLGGAFRRAPRALAMLGRGGPETRLFHLAMVAAALAAVGSAGAAVLAWAGVPLSLLADALRHLVTVGLLTSMVVGMGFRLIPVVEGLAPPWPRLRAVAFWALLSAVALRTAELLADYGLEWILRLVPISGVLVWIALACLGGGFVGAILRRGRPMTRVIGGGPAPP